MVLLDLQVNKPIIMSGLECNGTEDSLDKCKAAVYHPEGTPASKRCSTAQAVSVVCSAAGATNIRLRHSGI